MRSAITLCAVLCGFVTKSERGSVSAEDRTALIDWLRARPDVASARVSNLVDTWYTDFVTEDALAPVMG